MGYSAKWVLDNLGITRDMLRYYEKERLIPIHESRNPANNYRDYDQKDIEKIWGIKLLISIGFSAKEIYSLMNDSTFNFDDAIAKKVEELEKKHRETILNLKFAKTLKAMGQVPTASNIGGIRFDDFLAYIHEEWNIYDDPQISPFMRISDSLISLNTQETTPNNANHILEILENFDPEEMMHTYTLKGYFRVISDMQELGHDSETVQRVVRLVHSQLINHNKNPELNEVIMSQSFAKYMASFFLYGDVSKLHEQEYGKDGCLFIAQALAHYSQHDLDNQ